MRAPWMVGARVVYRRARVSMTRVALTALALGTAGRAAAEETRGGGCPVSVNPEDPPGEWRSAVAAIQARLGLPGRDTDCRAVAIVVEHDGAIVIFTTRDGRQALRRLDSPDELAPILDALLVTLQPRAPSSGIARLPEARASSTTAGLEQQPVAVGPRAVAVFLGSTAGGRLSAPGAFASPSLGVRVGAVVGSMELAAFGLWDPAHLLMAGATPPRFSMSRYDAGVLVGRRVPVGAASIAFGATASVALVTESVEEDAFAEEPLLGLYTAVLWPRRSSIRGRAELSADGAVTRVGSARRIDNTLPALPWWSAAASAGVEWEVP
jgi:hypothetical protein